MSKIIQALEKAKLEGGRSPVDDPLDERSTVGPLEGIPTSESRIPRARRVREGRSRDPVAAQSLSPELLASVDPHIETLHRPMSVIAEQFRAIRSRIERGDPEGRIRTIAVTSSIKGEGKTLTAANLAAVMANDASKRVLAVDADLRRPKLHTLLGLTLGPGLADLLEGRCAYEDVLRVTPWFGLTVVTAGNAEGHPGELLAGSAFSNFIERVSREFDCTVIDTPPLQPISDVRFLTESVDGVVLVVRANKTSKNALKHSVEALPSGKVIGAILNRVDGLGEGYGYGYSKGAYGYGYY